MNTNIRLGNPHTESKIFAFHLQVKKLNSFELRRKYSTYLTSTGLIKHNIGLDGLIDYLCLKDYLLFEWRVIILFQKTMILGDRYINLSFTIFELYAQYVRST